jgi:hypothetical protein
MLQTPRQRSAEPDAVPGASAWSAEPDAVPGASTWMRGEPAGFSRSTLRSVPPDVRRARVGELVESVVGELRP